MLTPAAIVEKAITDSGAPTPSRPISAVPSTPATRIPKPRRIAIHKPGSQKQYKPKRGF